MTTPAKANTHAPTMHDAVKKSAEIGSAGLAELFLHGLKDIYYAEKKLTKALPKMIKAAQSSELSGALSDHLEETQEHVSKVERVFALLDQTPKSTTCDAIDGIVDEAEAILEQFGKTRACDAAIIFAGQAAEHYEITRYGSLHAFALVLGYDEAAEIL
jgi:ferritin-like metal-binding protein YciE